MAIGRELQITGADAEEVVIAAARKDISDHESFDEMHSKIWPAKSRFKEVVVGALGLAAASVVLVTHVKQPWLAEAANRVADAVNQGN